MSRLTIGIDPGLSGGIAALNGDGQIIALSPMPNTLHGRRKTVCVKRLWEIIDNHDTKLTTVVIESAQKFSAGTNALTSTWFGFGRITALLEMNQIRHEIVSAPATWQKMFWTRPKLPKGVKFDTKEASIAAAKRLFPAHDFLATKRSKKPSDGLTDAALIAEYGRRLGL